MEPYYQEQGITIYHGDCLEIMAGLPPVDLVLADPPYGVRRNPNSGQRANRKKPVNPGGYGAVRGDDSKFNPATLLLMNIPSILWGANHYAARLPSTPGWLIWDKMRSAGLDQADGEAAWTNCVTQIRIFRHLWDGFWRTTERGEHYHPTQKPVALMKWCLALKGVPQEGLVLDPYMGAGPVLRAAKDLGREAIGIEIEERYCEIAAKRLQQEVLQFAEAGR